MATYIALLRGVNVGGNTLKMEVLRKLWAEIGFADVRTYVQSGNVVFSAADKPAAWLPRIERKLAGQTRLPVKVSIRSATELARLIEDNPFLDNSKCDVTKLHVTFLADSAPRGSAEALAKLAAEGEAVCIAKREVYLYCPHGYGTSRLSNNRLESALGVSCTTRNWKTLLALREMAGGR